MPTTSSDAPLATSMSLYAQNAQGSLADWVFSGTLERHPHLKIAYQPTDWPHATGPIPKAIKR